MKKLYATRHIRHFILIALGLLIFSSVSMQLQHKTLADISVTTHEKQFYTVGTKIVDPNGKVFVPIGSNVGFSPNNFDWAGSAKGQSDKALTWGWNTIRLTFVCTTAESYSQVTAKDGDTVLLNNIDKIVKEYTSKKMVVILECHDVKKNKNDAANFWTHAADRFKNNPYVWFNYANEPEWDNATAWITEQKEWLALIRSRGAENLFVADVLFTGNDLAYNGVKQIFDPSLGPELAYGQCNVLMSMHNYGGLSNSADDIMRPEPYIRYWQKVQDANLPMIIGEYGMDYRLTFEKQSNGKTKVVTTDGVKRPKDVVTDDYYNHASNGEFATLNYAKDFGIGMLAWHGTFSSGLNLSEQPNGGSDANGMNFRAANFYNMINDAGTGTSTNYSFSRMGLDLWNAGHNQPAQQTFTGDYRDSNCNSVKTIVSADPEPPTSTPTPSPTPSPSPSPASHSSGNSSSSGNSTPVSTITLEPIGSTESEEPEIESKPEYFATLPNTLDNQNEQSSDSSDSTSNTSDSPSSKDYSSSDNASSTQSSETKNTEKKKPNIVIPVAIGFGSIVAVAGFIKLAMIVLGFRLFS